MLASALQPPPESLDRPLTGTRPPAEDQVITQGLLHPEPVQAQLPQPPLTGVRVGEGGGLHHFQEQ